MILPRIRRTTRAGSPRWIITLLLPLVIVSGCSRDTSSSPDISGHGQISRPGEIGLPLNNPESVAAFETSERLLIAWFLLGDSEAALATIHPNFRETWRSLIEDTRIDRTCSLVQVEGSEPDVSGLVTARYAIGGCRVVAPGGLTAVYIRTSILHTDTGPWITQIEFLR